jgi:hypothetical protein
VARLTAILSQSIFALSPSGYCYGFGGWWILFVMDNLVLLTHLFFITLPFLNVFSKVLMRVSIPLNEQLHTFSTWHNFVVLIVTNTRLISNHNY